MKMVEGIQKGMKAAKKGRAIRELMQIIGSSGDLSEGVKFTPEKKAKYTMVVVNLFKGKISNARTVYDEAVKTCDEAINEAFRELEDYTRGSRHAGILNDVMAEYHEARTVYDAKIQNALQKFENSFKKPYFINNPVIAKTEGESAKKDYNKVIADARTQYNAVRGNYEERITEVLQELDGQLNKLEKTDASSIIKNAREEYKGVRKNYDETIQRALQDLGSHIKTTEHDDSVKKCEKAIKNAVEALEKLFKELESNNTCTNP